MKTKSATLSLPKTLTCVQVAGMVAVHVPATGDS